MHDEGTRLKDCVSGGACESALPVFDVILASSSPRRKQLLEQTGVTFTVLSADVDESLEPDDLAQPDQACRKLAERKAQAVVQQVLSDPSYVGSFVVLC